MKPADAVALLENAVPRDREDWADLGCGDGVFTKALMELLGDGSRIYAVDRDRRAIASLKRRFPDRPQLVPVVADFTRPLELPGFAHGLLDGILLANALHYVRDAEGVLARLVTMVRPGGRVVVIEYERRRANPWVPYPIGISRLGALAAFAGLSSPVVTATLSSKFGGDLYVAVADRPSRSESG